MSRRSHEERTQPCAEVRRAPSFALSAGLPMLAKLLIALIHVYQMTLSKLIVAAMGPVCRFEPSCSRYAAACILGHGALRGSLLSLKRLCRCHPFHPGGFDPPPPPLFAVARRPGWHRIGTLPRWITLAVPLLARSSPRSAGEPGSDDRTNFMD